MFYSHIYAKHINLYTTSNILTCVHFPECNTLTLLANLLGLAGSWWKLDKVVLVLKFTSGEERSRWLWSLSGVLFVNGFWPLGAWSWSVAMETSLIGMNPSLLLTGEECDFMKLTAMSTIVPTRQRNRITPHKTLWYKMMTDCKGQWSPTSLSVTRKFKYCNKLYSPPHDFHYHQHKVIWNTITGTIVSMSKPKRYILIDGNLKIMV